MVAVVEFFEHRVQLAAEAAVFAHAKDLGDDIGRQPEHPQFTGPLEDLVDGKVSAKDEITTVFDLVERVGAPQVDRGPVLLRELGSQDERPVVEPRADDLGTEPVGGPLAARADRRWRGTRCRLCGSARPGAGARPRRRNGRSDSRWSGTARRSRRTSPGGRAPRPGCRSSSACSETAAASRFGSLGRRWGTFGTCTPNFGPCSRLLRMKYGPNRLRRSMLVPYGRT